MAKVEDVSDQGKMVAAIGYAGFFFGLPLGVIGLFMRDDAFALEHGKHATAVWLLHFVLVLVLSFIISAIATVTCGLGAILYPIVLIPALAGAGTSIHGLILALQGDDSEPFGGFGLGPMLFASITLDETKVTKAAAKPAALEGPVEPPPPPAADDVPPPPPLA